MCDQTNICPSIALILLCVLRLAQARLVALSGNLCKAFFIGEVRADGQLAAEWLRSGEPHLVRKAIDYCRYDVELVVSLHSRLISGEPLRLLPRPARQELNELLWQLDGYERLPDESGAISTK